MVEIMKVKFVSFLLILGSYGVHAAPLPKAANNFTYDKFACPAATFSNNDEVINYFKQWKNCKHADGGFSFKNAEIIDFSAFKNITTIGKLSFDDSDFSKKINIFPQLTRASSVIIENSIGLTDLSFPLLYSAGNVSVKNSSDLSTKLFPTLKETENLTIMNSTNLLNLEFPQLTKTKLLKIAGNQDAASLDSTFPKLTSADTIDILSNERIKDIQFPVLYSLNCLHVEFNKWLQQVSIPELQNSEIDTLTLAENNIDFDQFGGDKGGLNDIKKINKSLTLTGNKFNFHSYPKPIKSIHFESYLSKNELKGIVTQLIQLHPQYSKDEKTKVILGQNDCYDLNNIDISKASFDIYAGNNYSGYPVKCGK